MLKNQCFQIVLEKTLESPLDSKNMKPLIPKEINPEYSLEELMFSNCDAENSLESLGLQRDQASQS